MTAPHGPSEKVLDGFLHRWKNLVGECEYTAATSNPALNRAAREALWALGAEIVAEVRAAVVAEIRDDGLDVDLTPEEERRWSEYARGERGEHRRVLGILRAPLPPRLRAGADAAERMAAGR